MGTDENHLLQIVGSSPPTRLPTWLPCFMLQVLEVYVNDSHLTGRPKVGKAVLRLKDLPPDGRLSVWLPLEPVNPGQRPQGEVHLDLTYKAFEDDEQVGAGSSLGVFWGFRFS